MLSTHPPPPPLSRRRSCIDCSAHSFLPRIPSPLSPRRNSGNVYGTRYPFDYMTSPSEPSNSTLRTPTRPVKKAPTPQHEEVVERRRKEFLRGVKERREGERDQRRGEDMMRLDFVTTRRRWEAERAAESPPEEELLDHIEDEDVAMSSSASAVEEEEAEAQIQLERGEVEALLEFMSVLNQGSGDGMVAEEEEQAKGEGNVWSDEEDYDELFSDIMIDDPSGGSRLAHLQHEQVGKVEQAADGGGEEMDLS